jgi:tellurite resistance protein TehA-like permease
MATGIVSIAADELGYGVISAALLAINRVAFGVLATLSLVRIVWFRRAVLNDFNDHGRGPGFFTVVAGACVLGTQEVLLVDGVAAARVLWFVGIGVWCVVMYGFFASAMIRQQKPTLEHGINGAWLIAVVATQSISILGTLLAPHFGESSPLVLLFTVCMFLVGAMHYLIIVTLIFYRLTFLEVTSQGLSPRYWINMGAVAICTLSGSTLLLAPEPSALLATLHPFLLGFTLCFWASATWWIPLLVILGVWRHVVQRYPLRYDPSYWGLVFPLGMYTACTAKLSQALSVDALMAIPRVFVFVAFIAWVAVFLGLVARLVSEVLGTPTLSRDGLHE